MQWLIKQQLNSNFSYRKQSGKLNADEKRYTVAVTVI